MKFNGISSYVCIGKYGGFDATMSDGVLRVNMGWLTFALLSFDLETTLIELLNGISHITSIDR